MFRVTMRCIKGEWEQFCDAGEIFGRENYENETILRRRGKTENAIYKRKIVIILRRRRKKNALKCDLQRKK